MLFTSVVLVLTVAFLLLVNNWSQNRGIVYLVSAILILCVRQLTLLLSMTVGHVDLLTFLMIHCDPIVSLSGPLLCYFSRV